jgi:hypothetical protein
LLLRHGQRNPAIRTRGFFSFVDLAVAAFGRADWRNHATKLSNQHCTFMTAEFMAFSL